MTPEQLKKVREFEGWTVVDAARRFGVNRKTWKRWEAGECRIPHAVRVLLYNMAQDTCPIPPEAIT